jgi:hypothetical protein
MTAHTARIWAAIFAVLAVVLGVCAAAIEVSLDYTNWWAVAAPVAAGISAIIGLMGRA